MRRERVVLGELGVASAADRVLDQEVNRRAGRLEPVERGLLGRVAGAAAEYDQRDDHDTGDDRAVPDTHPPADEVGAQDHREDDLPSARLREHDLERDEAHAEEEQEQACQRPLHLEEGEGDGQSERRGQRELVRIGDAEVTDPPLD